MSQYHFTYKIRRWSGAAALVDQLVMKMDIAEIEHEIHLEDHDGIQVVRLLVSEREKAAAFLRLGSYSRYLASEGPYVVSTSLGPKSN
jgi:hypothetical protein